MLYAPQFGCLERKFCDITFTFYGKTPHNYIPGVFLTYLYSFIYFWNGPEENLESAYMKKIISTRENGKKHVKE